MNCQLTDSRNTLLATNCHPSLTAHKDYMPLIANDRKARSQNLFKKPDKKTHASTFDS